jgi:hypothetical protein
MRSRRNPKLRQGPFASRVGMDGLYERFDKRSCDHRALLPPAGEGGRPPPGRMRAPGRMTAAAPHFQCGGQVRCTIGSACILSIHAARRGPMTSDSTKSAFRPAILRKSATKG